MKDAMLSELYERAFRSKNECARLNKTGSDDRLRQVELAKNNLLAELIDIRTDQIRGIR